MCNNICLVNKVYSINKIYNFLRSSQVHSNICLNYLSLLILFSLRTVIFYDGTLQKEWKGCHSPYGMNRTQNQLICSNQCFIIWSQDWWCLQQQFYRLRLFWLTWVFVSLVWIWILISQSLGRFALGYWWGLHWIIL